MRAGWQKDAAKRRRQIAERNNAYREYPKPGHGYFNPWQRTLGGMREGGCPRCAAEHYEAVRSGEFDGPSI